MKRIIMGMALISAFAFAGTASANNGNPQNCEHNPQQPFCGDTITVDQPTAIECPAGGFVLVLNDVRYPVCNGTNGTNGTNGADGTNGTNGSNGATGAVGPSGASGTTGANGVAGNPGAPGTDGSAGSNGAVTTVYVTVKHKKWTCVRREHRVHGKRVLVAACKHRSSKKQRPYVISKP